MCSSSSSTWKGTPGWRTTPTRADTRRECMRVHYVATRSSIRAGGPSPERPADIIATHEHPQGVCWRLRQVRLADFRSATAGRALFRYVFRQSSGTPNPNDPPRVGRIGDAALHGVTGTIRY